MALILLVPIALAIYTYVEIKRMEAAYPPNGKQVSVNGHRVHAVIKGQGQPVVLLHGASSTAQDFVLSPIFERLAKTYQVIAPDRPGYGYSERFDGAEDPAAQARDLHAFLQQEGVKNPLIVGFSWSGALATSYVLQYPDEVAGLVVINGVTHPWPLPENWTERFGNIPVLGSLLAWTLVMPVGRSMIAEGIRKIFSPVPVPGHYGAIPLEHLLRPSQFRANAADMMALKPFVAGQVSAYPQIKVPTVILVGEGDQIVSPQIHGAPFHQAVSGSRLIYVPNAGHPLHHSHPDAVIEAIESVLP